MTTRLYVTATAAFVWSAGLLAQPPGAAPKSADSRITVTGCVERADQVTGNTATTTVDSLSFVLIKPRADKPTGTSGTAASDAAAQPDRMYRLDGKLEELNPHVGHKVEIAGMVAETPTAPAGATSSTNAPRLKVESIRMIEPACPR